MITTTLDLMDTIMETTMEAGEVTMATLVTLATATTAIQEETVMAVGEVVMTAAVEEAMTAAAEVEVTAAAAAEVVENEAVRTLSIQCGFTLHTINEHGSLGPLDASSKYFGFDAGLPHLVEVVLHPPGTTWASASTASAIENDSSNACLLAKLVDHGSSLVEGMSGEVDGGGDSAALPVRPAHIHQQEISRCT